MYGWKIKTWNLNEREKMLDWINKNKSKYAINEIFVCNELAVEYKLLIKV